MPIPELTHLQFLVLGMLLERPRSGKALRAELRTHGGTRSGPAFYQLMARLEDFGWVEGRYDQKVVDGQIIRERRYRISAEGRAAWEACRAFYLGTIGRYGDDPLPV